MCLATGGMASPVSGILDGYPALSDVCVVTLRFGCIACCGSTCVGQQVCLNKGLYVSLLKTQDSQDFTICVLQRAPYWKRLQASDGKMNLENAAGSSLTMCLILHALLNSPAV